MANIDLKNAAVQKLMLAVLLAGGALGIYFFTHLVPFGFTNNNEKMAGWLVEYEKKSTELSRAIGGDDRPGQQRRAPAGDVVAQREHGGGIPSQAGR